MNKLMYDIQECTTVAIRLHIQQLKKQVGEASGTAVPSEASSLPATPEKRKRGRKPGQKNGTEEGKEKSKSKSKSPKKVKSEVKCEDSGEEEDEKADVKAEDDEV